VITHSSGVGYVLDGVSISKRMVLHWPTECPATNAGEQGECMSTTVKVENETTVVPRDLRHEIEIKIGELELTMKRLKVSNEKMVTVNKKVLLEYIAMARKYAMLRLEEQS
jgi:hypothetical protein